MKSTKTSEKLTDQAKQFYGSNDLSRYGRESLNDWEYLLIAEIISLAVHEPLIIELGCGRTRWKQLPGRYVACDLGFAVLKNKKDSKI